MSNVAVFCVMCGAFNENRDLFIMHVNENWVILRCFKNHKLKSQTCEIIEKLPDFLIFR